MYNDCDCSNNYGLGITQVALCPQIQMGSVQDFTGMFNVREFIPRVSGATYLKNSYIWYHSDFYQCLEDYTGTGVWDPTKWRKTDLLDLIGTGGGGGVGEAFKKIVGDPQVYDPAEVYYFGDFILDEEGYLLVCKAQSATGPYIEDQWEKMTVLDLLTEIVNILNRKTRVFDNYEDMCTYLNSPDRKPTDFDVPDDIMILNVDVPDAWVSEVFATAQTYQYTGDEQVIADLETHSLRIGYWMLSKLDTKVRLAPASRTNDGLMSKEDYAYLHDDCLTGTTVPVTVTYSDGTPVNYRFIQG